MAIHRNAGSRLFIFQTPVDVDSINRLDDEDAVAFFLALPESDRREVEEIEDFGEFGDTAEAITFTAVNNSRVRKLKGPRDAGEQAIVVGRDPLDDGQQAFIDAERTDFNYAILIELNDARTPEYSNSQMWYAGQVMSKPTNLGNVSNIVRRTFNVGINTAVYEILSQLTEAPGG